ncbi:MAG: hypothetical protein KGI03_04295 [Patescibacteria group bacterium]|nr:hypothetical protein [Patescibacteria group bacterium]
MARRPIPYEKKFEQLQQRLVSAYATFYVWKALQNDAYNKIYKHHNPFWAAVLPALQHEWLIELARVYEDSSWSKAGVVVSAQALAREAPNAARAKEAVDLLQANNSTIQSIGRLRDNQLAHNNARHLSDPKKLLEKFPLKYADIEDVFELTHKILSLLHPEDGHGYMLDHVKKEAEIHTKGLMELVWWVQQKRDQHREEWRKTGVGSIHFPPEHELEGIRPQPMGRYENEPPGGGSPKSFEDYPP